jgi:hypothetical protein
MRALHRLLARAPSTRHAATSPLQFRDRSPPPAVSPLSAWVTLPTSYGGFKPRAPRGARRRQGAPTPPRVDPDEYARRTWGESHCLRLAIRAAGLAPHVRCGSLVPHSRPWTGRLDAAHFRDTLASAAEPPAPPTPTGTPGSVHGLHSPPSLCPETPPSIPRCTLPTRVDRPVAHGLTGP